MAHLRSKPYYHHTCIAAGRNSPEMCPSTSGASSSEQGAAITTFWNDVATKLLIKEVKERQNYNEQQSKERAAEKEARLSMHKEKMDLFRDFVAAIKDKNAKN
ncbi:hypothetical protein KUTeg_000137 [Tegillarca granosa]|uniref:Uncharacterized protein n=1 Tax=Tegillarca granosa TaxID=220873 RepID=A0ABQ9FWP9_TEGGR|nr:hypothetical protein KUTeg_000137 [Tegillarca granosa]